MLGTRLTFVLHGLLSWFLEREKETRSLGLCKKNGSIHESVQLMFDFTKQMYFQSKQTFENKAPARPN